MKILRADASIGDSRIEELNFLLRIAVTDPSHAGYVHIVALLDKFVHKGPNGEHLCLVMEVMGENLVVLRERYKAFRLPLHVVKLIARQTLLGLNYLHESCGIVHTGFDMSASSMC